jgi:kinesin family protein C1
MNSLRPLRSVGNLRDVSLSTGMSMLRIDESQLPDKSKENQAIVRDKPPTTSKLSHKPSISTGLRNLRIDSNESATALMLYQAPGDSLVAPKTPSMIPVLSKAEAMPATPATPCRTPRISPNKTQFLTKDSNIPNFTAWDVRGRLEDMEAMYSELKDKFSGTSVERNGLEEAVVLYKARGQSCC